VRPGGRAARLRRPERQSRRPDYARAGGTNGGDTAVRSRSRSGARRPRRQPLFEGGDKTYGVETGAQILAPPACAPVTFRSPPGAPISASPVVVEAGDLSINPNANQQGGHIFIVSDCGLTSQGRVTSKGHDLGADLVHLESCTVLIEGLVESTGKGHTVDARNSCDNVADGLPNEVLRDHPPNSTGCVEVWGNLITIDSTNGWAGELNSISVTAGPAGP
jgi:hypothetical protein